MESRLDLDELSVINTLGEYIDLVVDRHGKDDGDGHILMTGFDPLDRNVRLRYGRNSLTIAAMPQYGGKSSLIYTVLSSLIHKGIKAFLYSPQEAETAIYDMLFSNMTGIPVEKLRKGSSNAEELDRIDAAARRIENSGLHIIGNRVMSIEDFAEAANEAKEKGECSIVLIDDADRTDLSSYEYGIAEEGRTRKLMETLRTIRMPVIATLSWVPATGTKKELVNALSPDGKGPDDIIITKEVRTGEALQYALSYETDEIMYFIDSDGTVRQEKVREHHDTMTYTDRDPDLFMEPVMDPSRWSDEEE